MHPSSRGGPGAATSNAPQGAKKTLIDPPATDAALKSKASDALDVLTSFAFEYAAASAAGARPETNVAGVNGGAETSSQRSTGGEVEVSESANIATANSVKSATSSSLPPLLPPHRSPSLRRLLPPAGETGELQGTTVSSPKSSASPKHASFSKTASSPSDAHLNSSAPPPAEEAKDVPMKRLLSGAEFDQDPNFARHPHSVAASGSRGSSGSSTGEPGTLQRLLTGASLDLGSPSTLSPQNQAAPGEFRKSFSGQLSESAVQGPAPLQRLLTGSDFDTMSSTATTSGLRRVNSGRILGKTSPAAPSTNGMSEHLLTIKRSDLIAFVTEELSRGADSRITHTTLAHETILLAHTELKAKSASKDQQPSSSASPPPRLVLYSLSQLTTIAMVQSLDHSLALDPATVKGEILAFPTTTTSTAQIAQLVRTTLKEHTDTKTPLRIKLLVDWSAYLDVSLFTDAIVQQGLRAMKGPGYIGALEVCMPEAKHTQVLDTWMTKDGALVKAKAVPWLMACANPTGESDVSAYSTGLVRMSEWYVGSPLWLLKSSVPMSKTLSQLLRQTKLLKQYCDAMLVVAGVDIDALDPSHSFATFNINERSLEGAQAERDEALAASNASSSSENVLAMVACDVVRGLIRYNDALQASGGFADIANKFQHIKAMNVHVLGESLRLCGLNKEAVEAFHQSLEIEHALLEQGEEGMTNHNVAESCKGLALLYVELGRYRDAEEAWRRALVLEWKDQALAQNTRSESLWSNRLTQTLYCLGYVLWVQNRTEEAIVYFHDVCVIKASGYTDPVEQASVVVEDLKTLAKLNEQCERYAAAKDCLLDLLRVFDQGKLHSEAASVLNALSRVMSAIKAKMDRDLIDEPADQAEAREQIARRAVQESAMAFGPYTPQVATALDVFADVLRKNNVLMGDPKVEARAARCAAKANAIREHVAAVETARMGFDSFSAQYSDLLSKGYGAVGASEEEKKRLYLAACAVADAKSLLSHTDHLEWKHTCVTLLGRFAGRSNPCVLSELRELALTHFDAGLVAESLRSFQNLESQLQVGAASEDDFVQGFHGVCASDWACVLSDALLAHRARRAYPRMSSQSSVGTHSTKNNFVGSALLTGGAAPGAEAIVPTTQQILDHFHDALARLRELCTRAASPELLTLYASELISATQIFLSVALDPTSGDALAAFEKNLEFLRDAVRTPRRLLIEAQMSLAELALRRASAGALNEQRNLTLDLAETHLKAAMCDAEEEVRETNAAPLATVRMGRVLCLVAHVQLRQGDAPQAAATARRAEQLFRSAERRDLAVHLASVGALVPALMERAFMCTDEETSQKSEALDAAIHSLTSALEEIGRGEARNQPACEYEDEVELVGANHLQRRRLERVACIGGVFPNGEPGPTGEPVSFAPSELQSTSVPDLVFRHGTVSKRLLQLNNQWIPVRPAPSLAYDVDEDGSDGITKEIALAYCALAECLFEKLLLSSTTLSSGAAGQEARDASVMQIDKLYRDAHVIVLELVRRGTWRDDELADVPPRLFNLSSIALADNPFMKRIEVGFEALQLFFGNSVAAETAEAPSQGSNAAAGSEDASQLPEVSSVGASGDHPAQTETSSTSERLIAVSTSRPHPTDSYEDLDENTEQWGGSVEGGSVAGSIFSGQDGGVGLSNLNNYTSSDKLSTLSPVHQLGSPHFSANRPVFASSMDQSAADANYATPVKSSTTPAAGAKPSSFLVRVLRVLGCAA